MAHWRLKANRAVKIGNGMEVRTLNFSIDPFDGSVQRALSAVWFEAYNGADERLGMKGWVSSGVAALTQAGCSSAQQAAFQRWIRGAEWDAGAFSEWKRAPALVSGFTPAEVSAAEDAARAFFRLDPVPLMTVKHWSVAMETIGDVLDRHPDERVQGLLSRLATE